jgi:hypothetical protein
MDPNLLSSLALMISRSSPFCPLRRLRIYSTAEEMPRGLEEVLRQTSALTTLETLIPHPLDIHALSSMSNTPLAPKLETCQFWIAILLSEEASHALNHFASQRCENHEGIDYKTELRRLKELRIPSDMYRGLTNTISQDNLQNKSFRTLRQGNLENWLPSDTSIRLDELRTRLFAYLPQLEYGMEADITRTPQFITEVFVEVLDEIESTAVLSGKDILVGPCLSHYLHCLHNTNSQDVTDHRDSFSIGMPYLAEDTTLQWISVQ